MSKTNKKIFETINHMSLNCAAPCIVHYEHCMLYSKQDNEEEKTKNKPMLNMI